MDNTILNKWIFGAALLLFAACTQDELTKQGDTLPEGMYPLQISGITLEAESSQQPWGADAPQTRVSETNDRNGSVWQDSDKINVQIGDGTPGVYTYTDGKLEVANDDAPAYWASTDNGQTITAWYTSSGSETVDLSKQINGLAYVLTAQTTANFNESVSLTFSHALAKVRVVLEGSDKGKVEDVKLKTCPSCTLNTDGTLTNGGTEAYIPMVKTSYNNGTKCWEANVVPGHAIKEFYINGNTKGELNGDGINPIAAKVNTITLTVGNREYTPSDENQTLDLDDGDEVNITGNGEDYTSGNFAINIEAGKTATVNLSNVKMKAAGGGNSTPAFNINGGGTVVFNLNGTENEIDGFESGLRGDWNVTAANIHVIGPGKLTIKGQNVNGGIITDKAKDILIKDATIVMDYGYTSGFIPGAAIGSGSGEECGDITIINSDISIDITITYQPSDWNTNNWFGAAIGPGHRGKCGNISITLQKGQTKDQFLNGISVRHTVFNAALTNEQKVGKGLFFQSCGTVTWLNADGISAN